MFHARRYLRSQALEKGAVGGGTVFVSLAQGIRCQFEYKAEMAQIEAKCQGGRYRHHSGRRLSCSMATWKNVEASKDEQGLARTVKILIGTKSQTERPSIIERAVQRVVLLF